MVSQGLIFDFNREIKGLKSEKNKSLAKELEAKINTYWDLFYNTPEDNTQSRNKLLQQIQDTANEVEMFGGKDFKVRVVGLGINKEIYFSQLQNNPYEIVNMVKESIRLFNSVYKETTETTKKKAIKRLIRTLQRAEKSLETGILDDKTTKDESGLLTYSLIGTKLIINTSG